VADRIEISPFLGGLNWVEFQLNFMDSSPAHQRSICPEFTTPVGGPQGDPCETPEPHTLEFRSAVKLKEKRKQRQLARSPYSRRATSVLHRAAGGGVVSVGVRRKLLEEEHQRLMGLPRGQVCLYAYTCV